VFVENDRFWTALADVKLPPPENDAGVVSELVERLTPENAVLAAGLVTSLMVRVTESPALIVASVVEALIVSVASLPPSVILALDAAHVWPVVVSSTTKSKDVLESSNTVPEGALTVMVAEPSVSTPELVKPSANRTYVAPPAAVLTAKVNLLGDDATARSSSNTAVKPNEPRSNAPVAATLAVSFAPFESTGWRRPSRAPPL
jgi:hypothetical protein